MIEPGKYREVGEPVEAIQLAPGNVLDVCAWIEEGGASAWLDEKAGLLAIRDQDDTHPWSGSLAWIGDWITKGSRGYRAVPSGHFAEHYERADWVDDDAMSAEDTVARFDALPPVDVACPGCGGAGYVPVRARVCAAQTSASTTVQVRYRCGTCHGTGGK